MRRTSLTSLLLAVVFAAPGTAQEVGRLTGIVVDQTTLRPVPGAEVRLGTHGATVSREDGTFQWMEIPEGRYVLVVEHIAYGIHTDSVTISDGLDTSVRVRMSPDAIELSELVVEAQSALERRRTSTGFSINELGPVRISEAAREGLDLAQLIQSDIPGVDARPGTTGVCVTYRAIRSGNSRGCDGVAVRIDGVPVSDPAYVYRTLPLRDIERVEMLSAAQAGVEYGMRTGQGLLLIETKKAGVERTRDLHRLRTGFGWEGESRPYPWARVLGTTAVVNAAAVTGTLLMADHCFRTPENQPLAIRTQCGSLGTTAATIISVAGPAFAGALAARWAGATDVSRGRLVPNFVGSALILTAGYLLILDGQGGTDVPGMVVLSVGVPLTHLVMDRALRIFR